MRSKAAPLATGLLTALIALVVTSAAQACISCSGGAPDLASSDFLRQFLANLHTGMMTTITAAQADLADGTLSGPMATALLFGTAYGGLHALGPGHGKAVVSSYFLTRPAEPREALFMGGEIALMHTAGAVILLIVGHLILSATLSPGADALRYLRLACYGLISLVGLWLLVRAVRSMLQLSRGEQVTSTCGHDHGHDHSHAHSRGTRLGLSALVGIVPCTGALIVMTFAVSHDAWAVGLAIIVAIAIGMGLTLSAVGYAANWLRSRSIDWLKGTSEVVVTLEFLGAGLVILSGAALFYATY